REGIEAVMNCYDDLVNSEKIINIEVLHTALELILNNNYFEFNNKYYLQINGTAMGTRVAPSFANIFMGRLEKSFLETQLKPLVYLRYIDDIFIIWQHGISQLHSFIQNFNNFHPSIKFTSNISSSEINFLDVNVKIINGCITTSLYRKPTDSPQYLHFASEHPKHVK